MFAYQAADDLLKDQIILVTGAGAGIGRAAALAFAQSGATVILSGRTTKKLEQVYDEIEAADGAQPAIFPLNLEAAVSKDYDDLALAIEQEFGQLDGLLHNASILGQRTPIEYYEPDSWHKVMQVNLHSAFLMTKSLIPVIRRATNGSIVFTSSSVGRQARAYWGAYAVSKFATEGLMQLLADELNGEDQQIRVNSVNPGAVRTGMRATAYPAEDPETLALPQDIMNIYLYLMGEDSLGVTGQAFDAQPK